MYIFEARAEVDDDFTANMFKSAEEVSDLLALLANEKRLMILCNLLGHELTVTELAERVGMKQSALSHQLAKLRNCGIVETRRVAQQIYYRLASPEVEEILSTLQGIYCRDGGR